MSANQHPADVIPPPYHLVLQYYTTTAAAAQPKPLASTATDLRRAASTASAGAATAWAGHRLRPSLPVSSRLSSILPQCITIPVRHRHHSLYRLPATAPQVAASSATQGGGLHFVNQLSRPRGLFHALQDGQRHLKVGAVPMLAARAPVWRCLWRRRVAAAGY